MNKKPFYLMALALCFSACKTTETHTVAPETTEKVGTLTPDEGTPKEQEEKIEQKEARAPKIIDEPTLPEELHEGLLLAMGCPKELIRPEGCQICPTQNEAQPMARPLRSGPVTEVRFTRGHYTNQDRLQVVAQMGPCLAKDGTEDMHQIVLLQREDNSTWTRLASTALQGVQSCDTLPVMGKVARSICHTKNNNNGLLVGGYYGLSWDVPVKTENATLPQPTTTKLVDTVEGYGCAENWSVTQEVKYSTKDQNLDGINELTLDVNTTEGMYIGPLDECMFGEFEKPLEPIRKEQIISVQYKYKIDANGFTEKEDSSDKPTLSDEFSRIIKERLAK